MLKRIYRAALGGHLYGFSAESQMEAFLEEYPLADQPAPIEVTAQQLAEWKSTGSWGDDWDRGRFIETGSLLRWPIDSREPKPMTPLIFELCWSEAPHYADRDTYISDLALSSMWGDAPESEVSQERIDLLGRIHDAAHMTAADLVRASGLTRRDFAMLYGIDYSTLTKWCRGERPMPNHVHVMLVRLLNLI